MKSFAKSSHVGRPWLPRIQRKAGSEVILFCFPYAGGTTHTYRNWDSLLPPMIEVCPVELPGRANRISELPATSIISLIESMMPALSPTWTSHLLSSGIAWSVD
jgi:surfactin synthase thioesterase subunit